MASPGQWDQRSDLWPSLRGRTLTICRRPITTAGGIPSSFIARWTGEVEYKMLFLPLILR